MKLAIISPFFPEISGVGQYGVRVAEGLAQTGRFSAVHVLANAWQGALPVEQRDGLTIERVWRRDRFDSAQAIVNAVRRLRPDVIWFNLGLSIYGASRVANFLGHIAPLMTKLMRQPTVVTLHELFEMANLSAIGAANGRLTRFGGAIAMRMILRADVVCLTLGSYARLVRERYGAPNLIHLPHGAPDLPHFTPLPPTKRILHFGLHAPYKGLQDLINMYGELHADDPAIWLTIAGSDHPRFPGYFESMRAAHARVPNIEWRLGLPEAELPALFESARVVALPYLATTGTSSVSHRAAAHGRPVVAYDLPDLRTVAAEENLQFEFVPQGDRAAFVARLRKLLNDPNECERIGRANVNSIQSQTMEITCQRYIEVFESVIKR